MRYVAIGIAGILALTGCGGDSTPGGVETAAKSLEEAVPGCSGDPWKRFDVSEITQPERDKEGYVVPKSTQRSDLAGSLESFGNEEYESAVTSAQDAAYEVCRSDSPVGPLIFWLPKTAGEGHARWVIRANDNARPLMVQSPHSFFEGNTMEQAVETFRALDARALLVNAGHRCSNQTASGCSGTTSVCGDEDFRESDMAHAVESFFQVAHRGIATAYPSIWAVSLHSMGGDGFSISDGTTNKTGPDSPVAKLFSGLENRFPEKRVTSCNAFGTVSSTKRLCGTTNVQGRQLNGSEQACTQGANQASDRFIHLEQTLEIRKEEASRESVIKAFDAILPE